MSAVELYKTPTENRPANPSDLLFQWPALRTIVSVDDWLDFDKQKVLKIQALDLLDKAWEFERKAEGFAPPLESSVFVERLGQSIPKLKEEFYRELRNRSKADRRVRKRLREIAAEQGFAGFVEDIERAIAGQYAYRLVGQFLFYFALRRKVVNLPDLRLGRNSKIPKDLQPYWDRGSPIRLRSDLCIK